MSLPSTETLNSNSQKMTPPDGTNSNSVESNTHNKKKLKNGNVTQAKTNDHSTNKPNCQEKLVELHEKNVSEVVDTTIQQPAKSSVEHTEERNISNLTLISQLIPGQMQTPIDLLFVSFAIVNNPKNEKQQIYKLLFTDGHEYLQLVQWGYSKIIKSFKTGTVLCLRSFRIDVDIQNSNDIYQCSFNKNNYTLINNAASLTDKSTVIIAVPTSKEETIVRFPFTSNTLVSFRSVVTQIKKQNLKTTNLTTCDLINTDNHNLAINASFYNLKQDLVSDKIYNINYVIYTPLPQPRIISSPFTKFDIIGDPKNLDFANVTNLTTSDHVTESFHLFENIVDDNRCMMASISSNKNLVIITSTFD